MTTCSRESTNYARMDSTGNFKRNLLSIRNKKNNNNGHKSHFTLKNVLFSLFESSKAWHGWVQGTRTTFLINMCTHIAVMIDVWRANKWKISMQVREGFLQVEEKSTHVLLLTHLIIHSRCWSSHLILLLNKKKSR